MKRIFGLLLVMVLMLSVAMAEAIYVPAEVVAAPTLESFNGKWNGKYQDFEGNMSDFSILTGMMDVVIEVQDGTVSYTYYEMGAPVYTMTGTGTLTGDEILVDLSATDMEPKGYAVRLLSDGLLYLAPVEGEIQEHWYCTKAE